MDTNQTLKRQIACSGVSQVCYKSHNNKQTQKKNHNIAQQRRVHAQVISFGVEEVLTRQSSQLTTWQGREQVCMYVCASMATEARSGSRQSS